MSLELGDRYYLEEANQAGGRRLCEDAPVFRSVPNGQEPRREMNFRPVAFFPSGTPIRVMKQVAHLDDRSRNKMLPASERRAAFSVSCGDAWGE